MSESKEEFTKRLVNAFSPEEIAGMYYAVLLREEELKKIIKEFENRNITKKERTMLDSKNFTCPACKSTNMLPYAMDSQEEYYNPDMGSKPNYKEWMDLSCNYCSLNIRVAEKALKIPIKKGRPKH